MESQTDITFSIEEGVKIQTRDLQFWKSILKDEVFKYLESWALSVNSQAKNGYDIRRGDALKYYVLAYHKNNIKVFNNLEEIILFDSDNEAEFIHFVRKIAIENEDEDISIFCKDEATKYIENYCDNLDII